MRKSITFGVTKERTATIDFDLVAVRIGWLEGDQDGDGFFLPNDDLADLVEKLRQFPDFNLAAAMKYQKPGEN